MTDRPAVLIVDDLPANLRALEQTLRDTDCRVVKAASGNEALTRTLADDFALAILDVQMPEMSGYELAEILRGDAKTAALPILFLTAAFTDEQNVFRGYRLGAVDYLLKPYEPLVLLSKVNVFLTLHAQRRALEKLTGHLEDLVRDRTRELEGALGRESALNEELRRLVHVTSHHLQEPLRAITSFAQLFQKRAANTLDPEAGEHIAYAIEGARRLRALLGDLVTYMDAGLSEEPLGEVDVGAVVGTVVKRLEPLAREVGAQIGWGGLPTVRARASQLDKVFTHLLDNALKFRSASAPRLAVSAARNGNEWTFSVQDNGVGIEAAFTERIFRVFERLDANPSNPGTGIGLAMSKKLVEHHGGRLWVEPAPGGGSLFRFTLPVADTDRKGPDRG